MSIATSFRSRIRPTTLLVVTVAVAGATYFEFVVSGPPSPFTIALWILVVPLLFAATVEGVRSHPLYYPLFSGSLVAVGVLQYLDGDWRLLAGLFVLAGLGGLASELRNRVNPSPS